MLYDFNGNKRGRHLSIQYVVARRQRIYLLDSSGVFQIPKCAGSAMIRYSHDSNSIYLCGGLGR
jgi:hypothetical protein